MLPDAIADVIDRIGPPFKPTAAPEIFGPTDINAQTGNGGLSVALNRRGTVTVFRWPRPSFYNHALHRTSDRDAPRFGAAPNQGVFFGLRLPGADGRTTWLRDWTVEQRYAADWSDAVETTFRSGEFGLRATVVDVVAPDEDALYREVTVERDPDADVRHETATLLLVENLTASVSKGVGRRSRNRVGEREHKDRARYDADRDALVHEKSGFDRTTDESRRAALAVGFDRASVGHQVGGDANADGVVDDAGAGGDARETSPGPRDAYFDAARGPLSGDDAHAGRTTGALAVPLDLGSGSDAATASVTAGETAAAAGRRLAAARDRDPAAVREEKRAWFAERLDDPPMPDTGDEAILAVARRALLTLVTNYDPESGAIVASIASQSPYAMDWPRDGAYFNRVLHVLGLEEWVEKRNRWYASLQREERRGLVPAGAWAMNYYGDGVRGGPIPWEIDQTGYAVWTLWDHYRLTGDDAYLRDVYPAIRRAADLLAGHRDPLSGLPLPAHEDDNAVPTRTTVGAVSVHLALGSAARAARELGREADAARYERRRAELGDAIDEAFWDPQAGAYADASPLERLADVPFVPDAVTDLPLWPTGATNPTFAWPAEFKPRDHPRMERHLERVWEDVARTFEEPERGERGWGAYETKALLALAKAWGDDPDRLADVREGLRWIARHHATPDTHVMGETWLTDGDSIVSAVSQPHTWTQLLFYHASLEAFPPEERELALGAEAVGVDSIGESAADD
jgi:hypothetical protein